MTSERMIVVDGNGVRECSEAEFRAEGRAKDCDCGMIRCVCLDARKHDKGCAFRRALTCAVGIECEHGYDVCPICDPCTCKKDEK